MLLVKYAGERLVQECWEEPAATWEENKQTNKKTHKIVMEEAEKRSGGKQPSGSE